MNFIGY